MRKILLIAAMVLTTASAQAAGSRSLTLASADEAPAAQQQPVATTASQESAKPADAPKYVDRPSAVSAAPAASTTTSAPAAAPAPAVDAAKPAPKTAARADKPKKKRYWTEGRIISELHRHGIYW
jgi:hypothetical protein